MYYFHYRQNNAGGMFVVNDKVSKHVILEATSAEHANMLAEHIGMDFNDGCPCCGERWSEVWEHEKEDTPRIEDCMNDSYGIETGKPLLYLYHLERSREVFYR
jgi:hypothetical protein